VALSAYARFGTTTVTGVQATQRQHTIVGNETIPQIAALEYGEGYDSEHWRQLAEANDIDDLDAVTVGTVLVVKPLQPPDT
jgi:nucleoid-associated protein YgaU